MKRLVFILCLLAAPGFAVQPDEVLDDPQLEARARDISAGLRCLVCRNESIDDSNAELARDLRLLVRERLVRRKLEAVREVVVNDGEFLLQETMRTTILGAVDEALNKVTDPPREWRDLAADLDVNLALMREISKRANAVLDERVNTNKEVVDYIVDRYGEYVLLKPQTGGANLILWLAGPVMLLLGGGLGLYFIRRRAAAPAAAEAKLTDEEQARLREIMKE